MPRKKNTRKKGRKSRPLRRLLSLGTGYPNALIAKHKYTEDLNLSGTYTNMDIPNTAKHVFRTASMYDPDYTIGGHQPLFFDQMAEIYNQYVVLGAVIKVKFINLTSEPVQVFLRHSTGMLGSGWDPDKLRERGTKHRILSGKEAGGNHCTITSYYSPSKFYGVSKSSVRTTDKFVHDLDEGVAPERNSYWEMALAQLDTALGDSADHKVRCCVDIQYTVMWNDRKDFNTDS